MLGTDMQTCCMRGLGMWGASVPQPCAGAEQPVGPSWCCRGLGGCGMLPCDAEDARSLLGDPSEHQTTCSAGIPCSLCIPNAAVKVSVGTFPKTLAEELLPGPFPGRGGSRSSGEHLERWEMHPPCPASILLCSTKNKLEKKIGHCINLGQVYKFCS